MKKIIPLLILLITTQNLISQTASELNSRGIKFAKKGKIDKAFSIFENAINRFPDAAGPYSNRGNIYSMRKEYDLAIQDYSKSIELNPQNLGVLYSRANTYLKKEEFENAIQDYSTIIEQNPSFKNIFFDRAYANIRLDNFQIAKTDLESHLVNNPKDFKSLANLINIKTKLELYEEALLDYEKLLKEFPNQPNLHIVYNNRASLYQETKEFQKALVDINLALKINKAYDMGLLNRAAINLKLDNKEQACKDFKKALKLGVEKNRHFESDEDFEALMANCN